MQALDSKLDGEQVKYIASEPNEWLDDLKAEINHLITTRGINPARIAVIGAYKWENLKLGSLPHSLGRLRLSDADPQAGCIPYYTYHKIKGCEFDYVIAFGVNDKWTKRSTSLYTAFSRAKIHLSIIHDQSFVLN